LEVFRFKVRVIIYALFFGVEKVLCWLLLQNSFDDGDLGCFLVPKSFE
jgi:hypothetical protein